MSDNAVDQPPPADSPKKITLYPAWCKRCGNCVAFCPRQVLKNDEWGYPQVAHPEKCISCHMCEMLCPDFAISVGEEVPVRKEGAWFKKQEPATPRGPRDFSHSPERLAPEPADREEEDDSE